MARSERWLSVLPDSGVLIEGLVSPWSASHGLLILGRCGTFRIILAEAVRQEVENDLLRRMEHDPQAARIAIDAYDKLVRLLRPERIPFPSPEDVLSYRPVIRHGPDVAILVSAVQAAPDWFVTTNTRHFTAEVGRRTGLRIVTPRQLIQRISIIR